MQRKITFFIVAIITLGLFALSLFGLEIGSFVIKGSNQMRYGIDIRGGVDATYEPKDLDRAPTEAELNSARSIIETRLDAANITDRDVSVDLTSGKVLVRFPWKSNEKNFDPEKAVAELGQTAELTFREPNDKNEPIVDGKVIISGKHVKTSSAVYQQLQDGSKDYEVKLELTSEGAALFEDATRRLKGKIISIYMDQNLISYPTVEDTITGGTAYITHMQSMDEAKGLSDQINSGALPFSMIAKNCNIISPTLGTKALDVMVQAGILALILVCIFMLFYYRLPGFVACLALLLQVSGQLLALSVPQFTLTLPGIAGVILSIGMGVDANVIISERIKEEMKAGKTLKAAIEAGFTKAFSSVFDGNITVIIVAIILMIFGSGSLLSFGYSLLSGVIMNFIAGVTASRLMIKSLSQFDFLKSPSLYGAGRASK